MLLVAVVAVTAICCLPAVQAFNRRPYRLQKSLGVSRGGDVGEPLVITDVRERRGIDEAQFVQLFLFYSSFYFYFLQMEM